MHQLQRGNKLAFIEPRTFGGFRLFLYNAYFDTEEELYFDSLKEAEEFANLWITLDWQINQVIIY